MATFRRDIAQRKATAEHIAQRKATPEHIAERKARTEHAARSSALRAQPRHRCILTMR